MTSMTQLCDSLDNILTIIENDCTNNNKCDFANNPVIETHKLKENIDNLNSDLQNCSNKIDDYLNNNYPYSTNNALYDQSKQLVASRKKTYIINVVMLVVMIFLIVYLYKSNKK